MEDLNILNRATFDDKQQTFKVSIQPCILEGFGTLDLGGPLNVFWVKHIAWKYEYIDVGFPGARVKLPLKKPVVSVSDIITDVDTALPSFQQPKPLPGKIEFKVKNTNLDNNHRLDLTFLLQGTLVRPKPNAEPLSLKTMHAYIMMDPGTKGQLAMQEALTDELDQTLSQMGMGSIRDLPKGFSAIKSLPGPIQAAIIQGLIAKGQLPESMNSLALPGGGMVGAKPPLALPDADPQKEESVFMGDMMEVCPDECQDVLKREYLRKIASQMVEKGWRRI